jgi:hypothetical protein
MKYNNLFCEEYRKTIEDSQHGEEGVIKEPYALMDKAWYRGYK